MDLSNENVIHKKENGVEFLQFRKLLEYSDIINHAYSLGIERNYRTLKANKQELEKEAYTKAMKDYQELCFAIKSRPEHLVKSSQAHTDKIKIVNKKINQNKPDFGEIEYDKLDGLITNKKEIMLATTNADCILLIFFDPVKKVIANTHSRLAWHITKNFCKNS